MERPNVSANPTLPGRMTFLPDSYLHRNWFPGIHSGRQFTHPYTTAACAVGAVTVTAGRDRTDRAVATRELKDTKLIITYHSAGL